MNDEYAPHISGLYKYKNTREFIDDLDFLLKSYSPIELPELILWSKGGGSLPKNRFLLTFDDGFREIYDIIAPILLDKGIPATYFICSSFLDNHELHYHHKASLLVDLIRKGIPTQAEGEIKKILVNMGIFFSQLSEGVLKIDYRRQEVLDNIAEILQVDFQMYLKTKQPYLTSGQVRELIDQGFTIGAHSIDHPHYSGLSLPEQLEQTIGSVKRIRETFGLDYGAFAFPHDDHGVSQEFFKTVGESGL
ncbi:MAG: polysaccharide deacetylase family protein, partial [Flavisolibacter sp.]